MHIEDTIFELHLPVNTIAMFNRGIEILRENDCNSPKFLKGDAKRRYMRLMWLLCNQVYDQVVDLTEEWEDLETEFFGER